MFLEKNIFADVQVDFHDTQNKNKVLEITPGPKLLDISYNYVSAQDNANTIVSIAPSKPHDVETSTEANFRNEIEPQAVSDSYTTNVNDSPYVEEPFQDSGSSYAPSGSDSTSGAMEKAPDEEQESSSQLVGQVWSQISPEVICNGFKKGGIFPYDSNVIKKKQYDPPAYKRWEQHKAQNKSVLENENINLPDSSANNHDNNQPGTSSSTPGSNKRNCTLEELLLETVKQAPSEPKKAKKRTGKGAEVITCIEHSNQTISTTKSLTENGNSESELSDPVYKDDDDIEAEMREQEDLEKCVEEIILVVVSSSVPTKSRRFREQPNQTQKAKQNQQRPAMPRSPKAQATCITITAKA
ncbi:hypothetical protein FQA39_LY16629 [Lamprigera yunnana]|nr:hypothetical protein FQA39_LY16629 [Lamprigera yunnana]